MSTGYLVWRVSAKCSNGFKIGTNEAYNIKIKISIGGILKIFLFVRQDYCLRQEHFTEEDILENVFTSLHEISVTIWKSPQM